MKNSILESVREIINKIFPLVLEATSREYLQEKVHAVFREMFFEELSPIFPLLFINFEIMIYLNNFTTLRLLNIERFKY
jgi:hypothetical protein